MNSKMKDGHRLNVLTNMETKLKTKEKARKELWDSLLAVYEHENRKEPNTRLQQEQIPDCSANQSRHRKYDVKLKKKEKSRHMKKNLEKENSDGEHNVAQEKDKDRHKFKELERQKKVLCATMEESYSKDKVKKSPSVIVLHKYKKDRYKTKNEPCSEEVYSTGKQSHKRDKNHQKTTVELKSHSQERMLLNFKSSCENLKSSCKIGVEDKPCPNQREQFKEKTRKKHDKGVVCKTLSTSLESKLRKRRKKLEKQQILKEVANRLNASEDIYDKIKSLPIKIDENQLIFMHPSHIAKALEFCEDKEINDQEKVNPNSTCNELNKSISHNMNKKEKKRASSTKLALDNRASSKRLRIWSSLKKFRKPIPIVLEETSNISFIKVPKNKRELKKRISKFSSAKIRSIQEISNTGKESGGSQELGMGNDLIQNETYQKQYSSVTRQNVCFGDNPIGTSNSQNDRIYTTVNDSLKIKPKLNNSTSDLKNCPAVHKSKNFFDKELKLRKNKKDSKKSRKIIQNSVGDSEDQIKSSSIGEDEKKLTFQLIKTNTNSENCKRLRKNVYSVSDRRTLMASKEKDSPIIQNDRLYVTKRMLFYSNKEPSSASKESLNIAIRRDTEISNDGSSNNILNVVIKQKKNSVTSTKSVNSPKLDIENQCSKNYNTKSLEKVLSENYLNKMCKDEQKCTNKNKHLKEAECQTEENAFNAGDSKDGTRDNVPTQSSELGNNTMQAEFRNFLIYHIQNMKPSFRENNAISNSVDEEMLNKKQLFQSGLDKIDFYSKFGDHNSNPVNRNMKLLTEHQYCRTMSSENKHNVNTELCTKNNCNSTVKEFYRIVSNDECNTQKTKCDEKIRVNKDSTSYNNKSSDKTIITRPNLRIVKDRCSKTESEHIAEKLKNIGLSDKRSFVKVINSNDRLETSVNTKVDFQDVPLLFKSIKIPDKHKDSTSEQVRPNKKNDFKKLISRRQPSQFSPTKIVQTGKVTNLSTEQITNVDLIRTKKNGSLGNDNTNVTDIYKLNQTNVCNIEKYSNNGKIAIEYNLKPNKHNFVNVLSASENKEKVDCDTMIQTKENHQNKFEVTKKTSCCIMRNFVVSEIGVQTESCDLLPTVPYKNISILKKNNNTKFDYVNQLNNEETGFLQKKLQLSNFDELVHIDNVGLLPQVKGSFFHVKNKKYDTHIDLNTDNTYVGETTQLGFPVNFPENNREKQISILKSCDEEKHIIDKVNAIYEFLQYLEKLLKGNSFLRLGTNIKSNFTAGHFNNTLRCLCHNCMEILNKIDAKESIDRNKILEIQKSLEKLVSQDENKNLLFRQIIDEPKHEYTKSLSNTSTNQYITSSEFNNESVISKDRKSNNHVNPFFVIISPEENSLKHNDYDGIKDTKSNQYLKIDNAKSETVKSKTYCEFEDRLDGALLKLKVNKCVALVKDQNSSSDKIITTDHFKNKAVCNKTPADGNNLVCEKIIERHTLPQDNSRKHLQSPSSGMLFEHEININNELNDNTTPNFKRHETSKTLFNYIKNVGSKSKCDSYCCRNSSGDSNSKKYQSPNSNSHLHNKSSKTILNHVKYDSSKSKLSSSCCKNSICHCCLTKNTSDTNVCSYRIQNSGGEIKHLLNKENCSNVGCKNKLLSGTQSKTVNDFELCKSCSNSMKNYCYRDIKPSETKLWIRRMTSPFKIPFKKDDKTAKKNVTNQTDLLSCNIMTIYETIALENTIEETKIELENNFETQQSTVLSNIPQIIVNHCNSPNVTIVNEDNNCKTYNRDSRVDVNQDNFEREKLGCKSPVDSKHQGNTYSFKTFGANSPCGSVIMNHNLQNENITEDINESKSVEYLDTASKFDDENEQNLEGRILDSDGWVPLSPSNIKEIKNNELHLDVGINDLPVSRVEYIQKFPKNFNNVDSLGTNKRI